VEELVEKDALQAGCQHGKAERAGCWLGVQQPRLGCLQLKWLLSSLLPRHLQHCEGCPHLRMRYKSHVSLNFAVPMMALLVAAGYKEDVEGKRSLGKQHFAVCSKE